MQIDWPLTLTFSTAVVAGAAWLYERYTYRGPNLSLENGVTPDEAPQRTVVMPFEQLPPATRELFPEYAPNLRYALARLVWLNMGDRAGAVHVKTVRADAEGTHLECSWYSYVPVPPSSVHTEPVLMRGFHQAETVVTVSIEFEWLKIRWWRFGKKRRLLRSGNGHFKVVVTQPVIPSPTVDPNATARSI